MPRRRTVQDQNKQALLLTGIDLGLSDSSLEERRVEESLYFIAFWCRTEAKTNHGRVCL
jgi:hypothetical protein